MADPRENKNWGDGRPIGNNHNYDNNQISGLSTEELLRLVNLGGNGGGGGPMGRGPGGDDSTDSSQRSTESSPNLSRQGADPEQNWGGGGPRENNNYDKNQISGPLAQDLMRQMGDRMQDQALRERLLEQRALQEQAHQQQALQVQSNPANNQIVLANHVLRNKLHESQQQLVQLRSQGQQELMQLRSQAEQELMELQSQLRDMQAEREMLKKQYSDVLSRERMMMIEAQTARDQRDQAIRARREWELRCKVTREELGRDFQEEKERGEDLQRTLQVTTRQCREYKAWIESRGRMGLDLINACKLEVDLQHKKMLTLKEELDRANQAEICELRRVMSGALLDELPLERQDADEDTLRLVENVETTEELIHALLGDEPQSATSEYRSGLPGLGFNENGSLDGMDEEMARIRLGSSSSSQSAPSSPKPTSEAPEIREEPGTKPIDVGTSASTPHARTPPPRVLDWLEETTKPGSDQQCLSPREVCREQGEADKARASPRGRKRASKEKSPTAKRLKTIDTRLVTDTPDPVEQRAPGSTDEPGKSLEPNWPSDQQPGSMPANRIVEVTDETPPKNGSDTSTSSRPHASSPSTTSGTSSANGDTSISPVDPISSTSTVVPPSNDSDGPTSTSVPPRPRGRRVPPPPTRKPIEQPGRKRASRHARIRGRQRPLRKWRYLRRRKVHSSIPGPWPSAPSLPMVGNQDTAMTTRLPMQEHGGVRARFMRFMRFLRARPRGVAVAITGLVYTTMMWRNWRTERAWLEANEVPYGVSGRIRRTEFQMEWFEGLRYDWAATGGDRSALG